MTPVAYTAYNRVAAETASKDQMLIMLFDGAVKYVRNARKNMEEKRTAAKGECISKAMAILIEFECALDHDIGGELAGDLARLYRYMLHRLLEANVMNDTGMLDEVEGLLMQLRDGFDQAAQMTRSAAPSRIAYSESGATGRISFAV